MSPHWGGVELEDIKKVKHSTYSVNVTKNASISSVSDIPLTKVLEISGSGLLCAVFNYFSQSVEYNQKYGKRIRVTIDGEIFIDVGNIKTGNSYSVNTSYMSIGFASDFSSVWSCALNTGNSGFGTSAYGSINNYSYGSVSAIPHADTTDPITRSGVVVYERPIIFHSGFKVELGCAMNWNPSSEVTSGITVRYYLT